uniref:Reverse transcriptase domain-containing protein, chloroplastic n=1 Tax=Tanacetum cinerariifolium TaxID=118510 RepID=A0A6L2J3D4_TANCI|nr:reverse transcriptase domain-containing protein, chloroplastic [Tanacetum cinerariifolium]
MSPTPKVRIRRSSKQKVENSNFEEHLTPVATMTDNRTMAEMLRAPTEGCAEAIVVPLILAEQFELKHSLINMMTSKQFFGLEKDNPHDHIRCSEIAKLTHAVNQQTSAVTIAMTAMLKQLQSNPPPAQVKAVEEICVTCEGAHPYYQCLAAGGNTFPGFQDNIQGYVSAAAGNYNQGNPGYRPEGVANQMRPPGFAQLNVQNNQNRFGQPQGFNRGTNFSQEQPYQATAQSNQNFHLNELEKIKRMNDVNLKAMQNQIDMMNTASTSGSGSLPGNTVANPKGELKAITTHSVLVTDGPTVPTPKSVNPEEDECVEETYTDPDLTKYTIKELVNTPLNENCSAVILKKLPKKLGDPGKFLIPCGFSELKCKALADLGASINLMPLSVCKKLGLLDLIPTRMTLELANRAICTPDGITRDVFVPVGKFTFQADFVVVDYESDPRVPLILGRPFLKTARALIDVHDCLEDLVSNKQSGNPTFSLHKEIASPKVIHEFHDSKGCNILSKEFPDIDCFNDIHPYFDDDPLSGSTTYSSNSLLKEFTDELALITYPLDYDDNLKCDIESDLKEIEFLLYQGKDFDLKDSIDQSDLANRDDLFVDPTPKMFTDEQPPDYSFPLRFDVYPDDFLEIESDADKFYDDLFDSKGRKSKNFSRDDDLPSPDNEDKVFNPGILIHEKSVTIITRVAQEKKLAVSDASLLFEDFDPPFYDVFKDVPNSMRLLPFSSENEEKVFKPGIYTSEKVHSYFLTELSHPGERIPKKDKIGSKPDKNRKRGEAGKSQKQLQWTKQEKLKKTQKEGPEMQTHTSFIQEERNIMSEPLSPDHVFDFPEDELEPHPAYNFFVPAPLPGYAGNPNNNNGWLTVDDYLLGELEAMVGERMVIPAIEEVAEPVAEAEEEQVIALVADIEEGQMDALMIDMEEDLAVLFSENDDFEDDSKSVNEEEA